MKTEKSIYHAKSDPEYREPFIDTDEERERILPDGKNCTYRYVHGGFKGTKVKFSFCYPSKETFKGKFYQYLSPFPGPDEEIASLEQTGTDDKIAFCLLNGAYSVETNMGSGAMFGSSDDPTVVYKSSAAAAEYSREKAMEIYGCRRPFGYVYGGSGGGYKTLACIENTDAWDGAAPYVIGSPVSLPNTITLHAQGQRCLRRVFGQIVDALDAGGSKDMYKGLTPDEAFMLKEITNMGFPPKAWFLEAAGNIDDGAMPVLAPGVKAADPGYFRDFWEVPGYLGADPNSSAVRDRLQFHGVVKSVHMPGCASLEEIGGGNGVDDAWKKMLADGSNAWIELEHVPEGELYLKGVNIYIETGAAAGKQLLLGGISKQYLLLGMCYGMDNLEEVLGEIKPGDTLCLDNSDYIAFQSYYRHQVPEDLSFHGWDQFRDKEGKPTLPQRKNVLGYSMNGTGTVQDGNIQGKVIVTQALMDESTCPWCGDWYINKVREAKGNTDHIRLYYMDRCLHGDVDGLENNQVINYLGALRQALLDLSDWVEKGIEPLPSSSYEVKENQIILAETAEERNGMQPVITFLANEDKCAYVKPGENVHFTIKADVPKGAGKITGIYLDVEEHDLVEHEKVFKNKIEFEPTKHGEIHGAIATFLHTYAEAGTYMASVKVLSNRTGNQSDPYTQVKNLERVRIIVE